MKKNVILSVGALLVCLAATTAPAFAATQPVNQAPGSGSSQVGTHGAGHTFSSDYIESTGG